MAGQTAGPCSRALLIEDPGYSASAVLRATVDELGKRGVTFVACGVQAPVLAELKRDGLLEIIGEEHMFDAAAGMLRVPSTIAGHRRIGHRRLT